MAGVLGVTLHHAEHAAPPMTTGPLTLTCTDAELDTLWPHALSLSLVTGRAFCLVGPEGAEPPKLKAAHLALGRAAAALRSEEHTSELQSRENLVCRLLLEKKNKKATHTEG